METETQAREKFAIVGVGCRLPPNANSLAGFWKFLLRGGNALKPVKKDRWDWRQYFDEDQRRPGKSYAPKAAWLDADVRQFDPLAFKISPREAASLDPQQRLLLESAWEAFEDAGVPLEKMSGSCTGVFIGGFCLDHLILQSQPSNRPLINAHSPGGVMMTVLSNRISHAFNLQGPSLTLDTACSSSLVALHYACQSLRLRECDLALAGGVNVMTRPEFPIIMSKGHFLSPHGECHAFDETAAGYARGEGAGILLLKRLEDALASGDAIHAVVRASGVNQDGHTDGISLPNSDAQEALIRRVYREAGLPTAEVDYVEAHGTGTQAGDAAELRALHQTFSEGRRRELVVGSVKTNIGHLEAAAGVAGVIKAIGVLKNRQVPKNLHFKNPNPKIPFADYCLKVATESTPLPPAEERPVLYAGVNSFGYGGTNAHILLESAPASAGESAGETSAPLIFPFSARSEKALRDLAGKLAFQLGQKLPGSFADLAHTMAFRRSHLEYRGVAFARDAEELRAHWIAASTGQPHEGIVMGAQPAEPEAGLVFVYTGMGPQWWAMGQELIRNERIVSETIDEIDGFFKNLSGWSLKEAMMAQEADSRMARTELAQPANFALQVALTRLWDSFGIRPAAVVGHSVGEVVSAYVAGVYTLEEAVRVSYHRSHLQQSTAGQGSMLAVGLAESEVNGLLAGRPGVSIAAINSFNAVTLSGDSDQLKDAAAELEKGGVFNKFLRVEVAYHSPQMEPLRDGLLAALADLAPKPAKRPLYSTAHGRILPGEEWDAAYWWHNVRQPVRFASAMQALFEEGFSSFLEVGPHPVLGNSIKECALHLGRKVQCFVSLRRAEPELPRILQTVGELYCAGYNPDWKVLAPPQGRFIPGPQYPWQRETYWLESEESQMERLGLPGPVYLNRSVTTENSSWEVEINRHYFPFLFDHAVQDQTVFAGMGYIEAALCLNRKIHEKQAVVLENVSFDKVLIVDYAKLQYLISEFAAEDGRFVISSRVEGEKDGFQRHCRGRMLPQANPHPGKLDLNALRQGCPEAVGLEAFYERLARRELHYGPAFRPTAQVFVGRDRFFAKIETRGAEGSDHLLHPTLFDAALQAILYCAPGERLFVPFAFEQFQFFSPPASAECYAYGELVSQTESQIIANVWLTDPEGHALAHARHISLQVIDMESKRAEDSLRYRLEWKPSALENTASLNGADVLILAGAEDSDEVLARELEAQLPGCGLVMHTESPPGFGKDGMAELLSREAARKHVVILWGTRAGATDAGAVCKLNEKVVGFLQAAGDVRPQGVDVTFVTRGAKAVTAGEKPVNFPASALGALGLVGQNEFESVQSRSIDLDPEGCAEAPAVLSEIAAASQGDIAYRNGRRFESVLASWREDAPEQPVTATVEEPIELRLGTKGKLDSLAFERAERRAPAEGEIELRVHSVSLNYKDVLKIEGHIHPIALENAFWGSDLGMECAGVVLRCGPNSRYSPGDRIVAILPRGFRSYATIPETFAVKIPDNLGMEAAAIPVVYATAYRGLIEIAGLRAGERILIHNATGGLGLAAVNIAQWAGAEIFATAGSEEKQRFLNDLGIANVFSSRNLDFGQRIREATGQEGIDVVISAQTGQAMHVSLSLLRTGGRYIEVGKKDIAEDHGLPLRDFNRNLLFASVDIDRLAMERPPLMRRTLEDVFAHFEKGHFRQASVQSFPAREIGEAFREMARSRHIGKLVADFSEGEVAVLEKPEAGPAIHPDGCYIVTGGTSGFGLVTARWLAEQGAGKVLLASRSGKNAPGIEETIRFMESLGTEVEVLAVDVTDAAQVSSLVERAGSPLRRLRGIIHGAMVLDDTLMTGLTEERFRRVFLPKISGALNLARALEDRPPVDFLIFYSSISAVVGNPGQTNYVAANGILDGLAHALRGAGIPATSINWGALGESGVIARDERLGAALSSAGVKGLGNQQALEALENAIRSGEAQVGVFDVDWKKWLAANPGLAADPRFREQCARAEDGGGNDAAAQIRKTLADASGEQRLRALEGHLQDVLANTLKMPKDMIPVNRKLNEMGVDSLMVLELNLGIKERIGINFSAMEFLKGPSLQQLAALAQSRLWSNGSPPQRTPQ